MTDIISFEEALKIVEGKNKHLLLGNGFSMDLFPEKFKYSKLKEEIESDDVKRLFDEFETSDFEYLLNVLSNAKKVLNVYDKSREVYKKVIKDIGRIKISLIKIINDLHPQLPSDINQAQYMCCNQFLKHFEKGEKFTLNYDLILYWAYMEIFNNPMYEEKLNFNDGFFREDGELKWSVKRRIKQDLHFLHGGLHLYRNEFGVLRKLNYSDSEKSISEQVEDYINVDIYPLFISEGTWKHKLKRIEDDSYLSNSYSSLGEIGGDIFIFGHSLDESDKHIFDKINNNKKIENIFISYFGSASEFETSNVKNTIEGWESNYEDRNYYVYDSKTAKVWSYE